MAVIDSAMENGTRVWKDRASGQSGLFAMLTAEQPAAEHPLPKVPDWTGPEKLTSEKEMLGFYITGHPLDQYKDKVAELATHTTSNLEGLAKGAEVALCGILTAIVRKRTREGKPWAAMQIEDLEGS
jgi:DNA polymerase-3 subunit alpha